MKKALSILLSAATAVTMLTGFGTSVFAEDSSAALKIAIVSSPSGVDDGLSTRTTTKVFWTLLMRTRILR